MGSEEGWRRQVTLVRSRPAVSCRKRDTLAGEVADRMPLSKRSEMPCGAILCQLDRIELGGKTWDRAGAARPRTA